MRKHLCHAMPLLRSSPRGGESIGQFSQEGVNRGTPADPGRRLLGRGCLVFVVASLLAMGVGLEGLFAQVHGVFVLELQPSHKD